MRGELVLLAASLVCVALPAHATGVIVDTDIYSDVDDVGALAILNAMADNGETQLLGVIVNTRSRWGAPCAEVINQFYGRGGVPIGTLKPNDDSVGRYDKLLTDSFPGPLKDGNQAPDAIAIYRRILAAQPAQAVTIASIGFLTNLAALLQSSPDAASPLDGRSLVSQSVKTLVVMGGQYPIGREFNFAGDPIAAAYVVAHWPTQIVFSGYEIGASIISGDTLDASVPANNPVRVAYQAYVGSGAGRSSWDLTAVYYAARGGGSLFSESAPGTNTIANDGANAWQPGAANQAYLVKSASDAQIARELNQLLVQAPRTPPARLPSGGCSTTSRGSTTPWPLLLAFGLWRLRKRFRRRRAPLKTA